MCFLKLFHVPGREETFKILREMFPGPCPCGSQSQPESLGLPTEAQGAPWVASPGWSSAVLLFHTLHTPAGNWKGIYCRMCQSERLLLLLKGHWRKPTGAKGTKERALMCGTGLERGAISALREEQGAQCLGGQHLGLPVFGANDWPSMIPPVSFPVTSGSPRNDAKVKAVRCRRREGGPGDTPPPNVQQ